MLKNTIEAEKLLNRRRHQTYVQAGISSRLLPCTRSPLKMELARDGQGWESDWGHETGLRHLTDWVGLAWSQEVVISHAMLAT
jgi:hypothetical protein